jgi:group I intron endonuclease
MIIVHFVFFTPIVYCEGAVDPFAVKQVFSDLSSFDIRTQINEAYSGVSGIYMFQCIVTGGMYIGSSINLYDRFYAHLNDFSSNLHLQNAANKYGWDSFIFCVIETCSPSDLIIREQFNLDILFNNFPKELIYNFCAIAYSTLGYIHTAETKALMSERKLGENNGFFGKSHTAESKAAMAAAKLGTTRTAETKAAMSINSPSRIYIFVYEHDTRKLVGEFHSQRLAAKFLGVSHFTVQNYLANGRVLNNKYIIRSSRLS